MAVKKAVSLLQELIDQQLFLSYGLISRELFNTLHDWSDPQDLLFSTRSLNMFDRHDHIKIVELTQKYATVDRTVTGIDASDRRIVGIKRDYGICVLVDFPDAKGEPGGILVINDYPWQHYRDAKLMDTVIRELEQSGPVPRKVAGE